MAMKQGLSQAKQVVGLLVVTKVVWVLGPQRAGTAGTRKSANHLGQGSSFAHK